MPSLSTFSDLTDFCLHISSPFSIVPLLFISLFVSPPIYFSQVVSWPLLLVLAPMAFDRVKSVVLGCPSAHEGSQQYHHLAHKSSDNWFQSWNWLWNTLSIRIWAWGSIMREGGFSENCFDMIWLKHFSSSHHSMLVIYVLVSKTGRFESISKLKLQLTWEGVAYPLENLQICN